MKPFAFLFATILSAAAALGQTPAVVASGLLNPTKLILTRAGSLLVTETGTTPNSGRVSLVDKGGVRRTLIDGLPSGLAAPDLAPDGPTGLALAPALDMLGTTGPTVLFIEIGEGDGFRNGVKPNTIVPNPDGPSSPILASILKLTVPQAIDNFTAGFTLSAQDHTTLADGNTVNLKAATGETATLELVSFFRNGVADPVTAWRNSHPYAMTLHPAFPDALFVVDAGMNTLMQVNMNTGRTRTVVHFAPIPSRVPGPPFSEAVPNSVRPFGNSLLVSFLTGFPFTPGTSQVVLVDPATGVVTPFIAGLSAAIDVLNVTRTGPRDLFFTLEYSASFLTGAPGLLKRYETAVGQTIASGLKGPTGMAYDAAAGTVYVALHGDGSIVKVTGQ